MLNGRSDFLTEFLHTSPTALLKTNCGNTLIADGSGSRRDQRRDRRHTNGGAHSGKPSAFKYHADCGVGGNITDGVSDDEDDARSLLGIAIEQADAAAVRTIVSCWRSFMVEMAAAQGAARSRTMPSDQSVRVPMEDLLQLAIHYPVEFERFICSVKLVPLGAQKAIPHGAQYMEVDASSGNRVMRTHRSDELRFPLRGENVTALLAKLGAPGDAAGQIVSEYLQQVPSYFTASSRSMNSVGDTDAASPAGQQHQWTRNRSKARHQQQFLYLPIERAVHMDMLMALTNTCERLESVDIFRSEAGQLILSYAWRAFGRRVHIKTMAIYLLYVFIATLSTTTFPYVHRREPVGSLTLIFLQLGMEIYFAISRMRQYWLSWRSIFDSTAWDFISVIVITWGAAANILRLIFWTQGIVTRVILSITTIFLWFNVLYFFRAFG